MVTRCFVLILVLALSVPAFRARTAAAQTGDQPAAPPVLTLLSTPPSVAIAIKGPTEVFGRTPLDLPSSVVGHFSLLTQGGGVAHTQGVFEFGARGEAPVMTSEGAGISAALLLRSLNFPGVPDMAAKRHVRGLSMGLAEIGALTLATRAHLRYRDRLDESGAVAAIRAGEERRNRNAWLFYGGAVWGLSAVDYWMLPRFTVYEATPTRLSLGVPTLGRAKIVVRSLVVPGAGQEFSNHGRRGALWLVGTIAAGAGYTAAEVAVQRKRADMAASRQLLAEATDPNDQARYRRQADLLGQDVRSAEDIRRGFGYGALVIYAANVVDAMALSLGPPASGTKPRVSATFGPLGPQVSLRLRY